MRAIDPQLDGLTLNRMDRAPREQVRDRLSARAHDILAQFGIGTGLFAGVVRETIVDAIIKPQLNGLLKL